MIAAAHDTVDLYFRYTHIETKALTHIKRHTLQYIYISGSVMSWLGGVQQIDDAGGGGWSSQKR